MENLRYIHYLRVVPKKEPVFAGTTNTTTPIGIKAQLDEEGLQAAEDIAGDQKQAYTMGLLARLDPHTATVMWELIGLGSEEGAAMSLKMDVFDVHQIRAGAEANLGQRVALDSEKLHIVRDEEDIYPTPDRPLCSGRILYLQKER